MRTLTRYLSFLAKTGNSESKLQIYTNYTCRVLQITRRCGHCTFCLGEGQSSSTMLQDEHRFKVCTGMSKSQVLVSFQTPKKYHEIGPMSKDILYYLYSSLVVTKSQPRKAKTCNRPLRAACLSAPSSDLD